MIRPTAALGDQSGIGQRAAGDVEIDAVVVVGLDGPGIVDVDAAGERLQRRREGHRRAAAGLEEVLRGGAVDHSANAQRRVVGVDGVSDAVHRQGRAADHLAALGGQGLSRRAGPGRVDVALAGRALRGGVRGPRCAKRQGRCAHRQAAATHRRYAPGSPRADPSDDHRLPALPRNRRASGPAPPGRDHVQMDWFSRLMAAGGAVIGAPIGAVRGWRSSAHRRRVAPTRSASCWTSSTTRRWRPSCGPPSSSASPT